MRCLATIGFAAFLLSGGCPQDVNSGRETRVVPRIALSVSQGAAPLRVTASGAQSSSLNGAIVSFLWDFAGRAAADTASATHLFDVPGRYVIMLTVTDESGASATAAADVRVEGVGATAVIETNVESGVAPLAVIFDGAASSAPDDTILDYFWDFGDGESSRRTTTQHIYRSAGEFLVSLRVVTGGGVEAAAETVIAVTAPAGSTGGSLQFNGSQFATLPVEGQTPLSACTFEAWFKAEPAGGTLLTMGAPAVAVVIAPSEDAIHVQIGSESLDATATDLAGRWRHLALVYDTAAGATVYLDGVALTSAPVSEEVTINTLTLGSGFRGKTADVRFWASPRGAAEVGASRVLRLNGDEEGLVGNWPLNEGRGQQLDNIVGEGRDGALGSSDAVEDADPAWSADGAPLP